MLAAYVFSVDFFLLKGGSLFSFSLLVHWVVWRSVWLIARRGKLARYKRRLNQLFTHVTHQAHPLARPKIVEIHAFNQLPGFWWFAPNN